MGNVSSGGANHRRRHSGAIRRSHPPPPPPVTPQPEIAANPFVYHGAAPYPNPTLHYPQYHYPGYYPPAPPIPHQHHHQQHQHHHLQHQHHHPQNQHQHHLHMDPAWIPGRYPCGPVMPNPAPFVEHQKAVTIRNDVNIRKESLRLEPDEGNSSHFLISFSFDATVSGRLMGVMLMRGIFFIGMMLSWGIIRMVLACLSYLLYCLGSFILALMVT